MRITRHGKEVVHACCPCRRRPVITDEQIAQYWPDRCAAASIRPATVAAVATPIPCAARATERGMTAFILDASVVTAAWLLPDTASEHTAAFHPEGHPP